MPKRFTDSEKWEDPWFRKLPPYGKLMILYLYDKCDIAGFWEIDLEAAAFKIGISHQEALEAIKGLERAYETNGEYIWIKRFVRFQGNKDLNENNKAHLGIIRLLQAREGFSENVSRVLNGTDLPSPYEGATKGLLSLTSISKGIGKSNGKGLELPKDTDSGFEQFWQHFKAIGRNTEKVKARKAWDTTLKGRPGASGHKPVEPSVLIEAANHYRMSCEAEKTEPKFVKQPATFLGPDRHWEDWREKRAPSGNGNGATMKEEERLTMAHDPSIYDRGRRG